MKAKRTKYRLSPNEEAQLVKDETERRRKQRIIQVREQAKQNASKIRQAVKEEKDRQVQKLALELQNQLEKEKEEKVRKLEAQYENSLKSIGHGHQEAGEHYDRAEEKELLKNDDNRRAEARGSAAMDKLRRDKLFREFEETKQIKARQAALEEEKERAARIAALPPPAPDPVLNINVPSKKPVKMTDVDNFTTTHYHILEQYSIDKADPVKQEDARAAAEEEERRIRERSQELVRLSNDRMARARVRHNNALEKEILDHDYDKMLMDLSDLQRADRERRLNIVANIPKQVFEPPHRRIEDREEHQRNLETAFEDMYMTQTNYVGDLSLALDPHPPPETPSATESLEVSTMTDGTPVQEPTLPRIPPVLKDMTNIPRAPGEKSPVKKPEKVLRKLMDKIKSQRDEWISKSNADLNLPDDSTSREYTTESHRSTLPVTDQIPIKLKEADSTADHAVDTVLQQQKEIENQKRVLEEKLKALEAEHAAAKQLIPDIRPMTTPTQPPIQPQLINGHIATEPLSSALSWSVPHSGSLTSQPYLTTAGSQQYRPTERIEMRVPEQTYPIPVTLLPREPVVSSLPKQYVPLSHRQQIQQHDLSYQPPTFATSGIQPPNYTSAMSQIQSRHDSGGISHPTQQHYIPQSMPPVSALVHDSVQQPPTQHQYMPSVGPPVSALTHDRTQQPHLSISSLSSSSGEYYPQTFPTPSLPVPSTVGLIPSNIYAQQDHAKKIKDYQQYLLQRHEQSKQVLADTRAEIERRRQELLQRFPQLASKSPESTDTRKEEQHVPTSAPAVEPEIASSKQAEPGATVSPSKAAISSLVSKLASDPYYSQRLGPEKPDEGSKPESSQVSKKFKDVRKSLPFDESLQESPYPTIHDSGGKSKKIDFDSTVETDDGRKDLDDTVMSSSTDRGSPKLPLNVRRSGQLTESDLDSSSQSTGKDQSDIYDKRQEELRKQLEEIQRQKDSILQRHDMAHLRLHAEQERLKYQMEEEERLKQLTPDIVSEDSTTEVDTDEERRGDVLTTKHLRAPPQKQKMTLLSEHRPHELSTIQEVDTPRSAPRSFESGRPSLSSSGSSVSRRSLDPYQLSTGTIPEEREPQELKISPTNRRTVGETGYHTQQIEEILERAREFDPSVVERFKRQTNEVFADISTPPQKTGTPGSNMSLSVGSLTPDSLSTGPISDSNVSTQYNSPADAPAFKLVKGKDTSRSDSSYPSGMSWADELSSYSGQYQSVKLDDSSKVSVDSRLEPVSKVLSSSQEKLTGESTSKPRPSKSPVDRKYDVFHMRSEQPSIRKSDGTIDSRISRQTNDESGVSHASSKLSMHDLSEFSGSEKSLTQGVPDLSQYPLLDKLGQTEKSSSDDPSRGYTSSSAMNESSGRESPLGGIDTENVDDRLLKTGESLGSTATSASSYMDLDSVQGLKRPFDFMGQFKLPGQDRTLTSTTGDLIDLDSSKYSGKGGFTSTPYTTQEKVTSQQLSGLSQYTLTPEESHITRGSLPQQFIESSSKQTPISLSHQEDTRSSDNSAPSSGEKKVGATLSQYSLKSDTQGVTLIGKELSQYSLGSENVSPLSQYSIEPSENVSPDNAVKSISQFSIEPSMDQGTIDESSSLSQHSLDPTRRISGISLSKDDKSITQYSFSTNMTRDTTQASRQDNKNGHLSQYSLQSDERSLAHGKLNDSDLGRSNLSSAHTIGASLSQHTMDDTNDNNEGLVEKKFANLDLLIRESRDLIAKHKQLITKNKEWEERSGPSTPEQKDDNQNNKSNLFEINFVQKESDLIPPTETSGSSFNVTDDISPMMITASSADITQDHLRTIDSVSIDNSTGQKVAGDSAISRLSQLDNTAGISDEPDLTLVTESSDISMTQEGQLTHRSEESNNNDSVWSFEQHEQSAMSSPDITENDFPDLPHDKEEDDNNTGLATQSLQESFERRQHSMPSVKRDAGEDVVFRAVPVVVSPTLSFSMNLNAADIKPKAPLTWASEFAAEKELPAVSAGTKPTFKLAETKMDFKTDQASKKSEKPTTVQKSGAILNPALQPRSAGSLPSTSSSSQKSTTGQSKAAGIMSLGEFLKRQISNEDDKSNQSDAFIHKKNTAVVTAKSMPSPSITTKPASPNKSTASISFYGKSKEAGTSKVSSFSVGKKTGTSSSGKTGIYGSGKSQGTKPSTSSYMSKTLSSWKKNRAVKSSGLPPPPKPSTEMPGGVKDFSKPVARSEDDEAYERRMRAYNPRLFRLQNRLGIEEQEEPPIEEKKKSSKSRETLEEKQKRAASNRDKVKEFQKKLQENMRKKQMLKKQDS